MKHRLALLLILCWFLLVGTTSATWYDSDWDCRKSFTINNTGSNLTNYQIMFTVNRSAGSDSGTTVYLDGKCQDDYDDIRFVASDDTTLYDYWVESNTSTVATVWVEFSSLSTGDTTCYLYYGNSGASAVSDGDATFPFFDDFPGSSLDGSKWNSPGGGSVSINGGILQWDLGSSVGENSIVSKAGVSGDGYSIRSKCRYTTRININDRSTGISIRCNTNVKNQGIYCDSGSVIQLIETSVKAGTTIFSPSVQSTWYTLETTAIANTMYGRVNDGSWGSWDRAALTGNFGLHAVNYVTGTHTSQYDWVLIRKYTATEPTVSAWGSEEEGKNCFENGNFESYTFDGWDIADSGAANTTITRSITNVDKYEGLRSFECYINVTSGTGGMVYLNQTITPLVDQVSFWYKIDSISGDLSHFTWYCGEENATITTNVTSWTNVVANVTPDVEVTLSIHMRASDTGLGACGIRAHVDNVKPTCVVPPVTAFSANATSGYPNFTVAFTDATTETPIDWDWYVNDVKVSDLQNPEYSFDDVIGNTITYYTVGLNATNGSGYDWENKTNYIAAYPLNASFGANATSVDLGDAILFTDYTDNGTATAWNWSFGDGSYSSLQNPEYTYTTNGTFNITLNASNLYSWDIETKDAYITIGEAPYELHTLGIYGNTSTLNVSFYGSSDITSDYWFEFSATSDGFTMATEPENFTAGDPVEIDSPRVPYIANTTYYYRIAREDSNGTVSYGETLTFTAASVAPLPTTTYKEEYYIPFYRAKWNLSVLAGIVPLPYFAKFGYLLWAIFWGAILMAFWVRQEDVTIPSFIYLIVFFTLDLADLLPSSFVTVSWVFAGICLGAILYTLFRGRKHG